MGRILYAQLMGNYLTVKSQLPKRFTQLHLTSTHLTLQMIGAKIWVVIKL